MRSVMCYVSKQYRQYGASENIFTILEFMFSLQLKQLLGLFTRGLLVTCISCMTQNCINY